MTTKRRGLGAGVLSHTPDAGDVAAVVRELAGAGEVLRNVNPSDVTRSPWQPRTVFDPVELQSLADNMAVNGLLQPPVVRDVGGRLELLAGERRLEAAKLLSWRTLPVRVLSADDASAAAIALAENSARAELTPWDEAHGLARLRDTLKASGRDATQTRLAALSGRSLGAVNESLAIAAGITPAVLKLAAVDAMAAKRLPKTVLHSASKGADDRERAELLRTAAGLRAPGHALIHRKKKAKRRAEPYTLTVRDDGRLVLQLRRSPAELRPDDARELLDKLSPVIKELRRRAND